MATPPNVFISHSSKDKDRFVTSFAGRLRASGIDAWVDNWELLPGDSLVRKIFEEGLKNAAAVIVVLSQHSVRSRWVREELDAAVVKRIESDSRLIPVVIDDCEIPEVLKTTLWERIDDLTNYGAQYDRILRSILGKLEKPPLGELPLWARKPIGALPGRLTEQDTHVLFIACEVAMNGDGHPLVETNEVLERAPGADLTADAVHESLEILESEHFIEGKRTLDGMYAFAIQNHAFDVYARTRFAEYDSHIRRLAGAILNEGMCNNYQLAEYLSFPLPLVNHILASFEESGFVKLVKVLGGNIDVLRSTPRFTRWLTGAAS